MKRCAIISGSVTATSATSRPTVITMETEAAFTVAAQSGLDVGSNQVWCIGVQRARPAMWTVKRQDARRRNISVLMIMVD